MYACRLQYRPNFALALSIRESFARHIEFYFQFEEGEGEEVKEIASKKRGKTVLATLPPPFAPHPNSAS